MATATLVRDVALHFREVRYSEVLISLIKTLLMGYSG